MPNVSGSSTKIGLPGSLLRRLCNGSSEYSADFSGLLNGVIFSRSPLSRLILFLSISNLSLILSSNPNPCLYLASSLSILLIISAIDGSTSWSSPLSWSLLRWRWRALRRARFCSFSSHTLIFLRKIVLSFCFSLLLISSFFKEMINFASASSRTI
jgi:hypothetical protein